MSDENDSGAQAPNESPDAPSGDDGGDDMVTLSRADIDRLYQSARNSAAAEMRKNGEFKRQKAQHDDPRVKRGLELLAKYEGADAFKKNVLTAIDANSGKPAPAPQQAAQPQSEIAQLVELMRMDIASRMADKLPKAPPQYASAGQQINAEMQTAIADIEGDATLSESQRTAKIQQAVLNKLKTVKVRAAGSSDLPAWAQPKNRK